MTYATVEASAHSGNPVLLFSFTTGSTTWRRTNAGANVTYGGNTYTASPLTTTDFTVTGEMRKDALKITFPRDDSFVTQFLGYGPDLVTTVTVYRGHVSDGSFITYWKGRVISSRAQDSSVTLECENVFSSLRRTGLRARYQRTCRHALYSTACGVDKTSFDVSGTATAAAGLSVTVTEASSQADGWWVGGMLASADGTLRLITAHTGTSLTLSRPILSLQSYITAHGSASVTLYPGCDHTMGANGCAKFSNVTNFGGFPWIPTKNPFNASLSGSIG